jgi:hypothetical protein
MSAKIRPEMAVGRLFSTVRPFKTPIGRYLSMFGDSPGVLLF